MRMTPQRAAILTELRRSRAHPTADEIFRRVRRPLPHISLGAVYRNLQRLVDCGEVQEFPGDGVQRRFDGNAADHGHVRCVACGRIAALPPMAMDDIERQAACATDFHIVGRRLEFFGLCGKCR